MSKIPHERTKEGRQFLALERRILKWRDQNRGKVSEEDIGVAEWLHCEAYLSAHNGTVPGKSLDMIERLFELLRDGASGGRG